MAPVRHVGLLKMFEIFAVDREYTVTQKAS